MNRVDDMLSPTNKSIFPDRDAQSAASSVQSNSSKKKPKEEIKIKFGGIIFNCG